MKPATAAVRPQVMRRRHGSVQRAPGKPEHATDQPGSEMASNGESRSEFARSGLSGCGCPPRRHAEDISQARKRSCQARAPGQVGSQPESSDGHLIPAHAFPRTRCPFIEPRSSWPRECAELVDMGATRPGRHAGGRGTGEVWRGPQAAGHRGAVRGSGRARRAAARMGASEAAAPRRCFPGLTSAAYGGSLRRSLSLGCSRPSFAAHGLAVRPGAPKVRP